MSKFIIKHITKTAEDTNLASFITGSIKNWLDPTQLVSIPDRLFKGTQLKEAIFTNCNYVAPEAFANCYNLTTLNLSTFNINLVTDIGYMFYECIRRSATKYFS